MTDTIAAVTGDAIVEDTVGARPAPCWAKVMALLSELIAGAGVPPALVASVTALLRLFRIAAFVGVR